MAFAWQRWLTAGALALTATVCPVAAALPVVKIGMIFDGPWARNDEIRALTQQEIRTLVAGELDVRFPAAAELEGDWTLETARAQLETLLADPDVDLVITWGVLASHAVCCYGSPPKPVIAPVILDRALQDLPYDSGASGVPNLNYVTLPDNTLQELRLFQQVVPLRKVVFLANGTMLAAIPELLSRTHRLAGELGLDFAFVPVGWSVEEVLAAIPEDADGVFIWPQLHWSGEQLEQLMAGLNGRRLPTFSTLGGDMLEAGVLATSGLDDLFARLSRRVALNVQRILLGEDAGTLPVAFSYRERLTLNMATARAIGVSPRWEALLEADLINVVDPSLPRRSLTSTAQQAVAVNLDLAAEQLAVAAGAREPQRARALLLPQLEVSARGLLIDEDRAASSFGTQAERTWSGSAELSQLLYAEDVLANVTIQDHLQQQRVYGYDQLRLDIAFEAAMIYLNLLRAKILEQVRRNNLQLTRSNLELAQIRRSVGTANPAEVFRWQSQIAVDRRALVLANADVRGAEIRLNRLLHQPQDERFLTEEVDPKPISARFTGYIETPRHFEVLQDFAVLEGLAAAPELQQLEAAIAAQQRAATAARRAFWSPVVAAQLGLEHIVERGGAGSEGNPLAAEGPDDTSWSVGLSASLPLFTGGDRTARRLQAEEELAALERQRDAVAERLEEGMRSAMVATRASFAGIELARLAAEAARQSLDLAADAYARGAVSILDLLDAQNAALNAELDAGNAVYDFFTDLMRVQRSTSQLDFFISPEAQDDWFRRLDAFFVAAGMARWQPSPGGADR